MPAEGRPLLSSGLPTDHPLYYPEWWRADLSSEGDFTDAVGLPDATRSHHMPFLSRVDVLAHEHVTTVAVHGTSFTDGLDFRGVPAPGYYSEQKEAMRVELNDWIRDSGDLPMRDPEDPGQFTDEYRHSSK
ncbi:hypothetical protein AB0H45_32510 [Streptomyces atroolivaceus]|uniref:Uncharacterized protein n=1 Tax=Streptomyces atroolivaceus TaxID=66869 RepID=A0ABV9VE16_STRAZ|nr:hypothetical protein [Streptomyces atroolivaceus]